ncbi:MAG: hemolysin XhlA family protein [Mycoplasmataceae bacterium]|jgi:tetrahydromethanopterin S-methyltransferase subunit G|nr:hemolysin XhlA family protein [Mycoplasmataceae bacterium]
MSKFSYSGRVPKPDIIGEILKRLEKMDLKLDNIDTRLIKLENKVDNIDTRLIKLENKVDNVIFLNNLKTK